MTAIYYDTLPLEDLRIALPALCIAIVHRCFTTPEPEKEPSARDLTVMTFLPMIEPDVEPGLIDPFHAAAKFAIEFGEGVSVTNSAVLANAWAYLIALSLREDQKLDRVVPVLSVDKFGYCIGRGGMLGYFEDPNTGRYTTYITLRGLIDKVHGDAWLDQVHQDLLVLYRDWTAGQGRERATELEEELGLVYIYDDYDVVDDAELV